MKDNHHFSCENCHRETPMIDSNSTPLRASDETSLPAVECMDRTELNSLEIQQLRAKVAWKILPYVFVLYIIAYLDRANVAFAKLDMSSALGFSERIFSFGAGIFFIGYLVLEIPSTIAVEKWGARRLMARILLTWGACTVVTGFVQTPNQFYLARFLLGVAEGGFFPGIIVYLSQWFTREDRSRAFAGFIIGIPVAMAIGGPVSAWILTFDWFGLTGWQWVFILEGAPAIIAGVLTFYYLADRPEKAKWLSQREKAWLAARLAEERMEPGKSGGHMSIWAAFRQPAVLLLALGLFFANLANYCFIFWLPTSIQKLTGGSSAAAAAWSGIPFAVTIGLMFWWARSSDRSGRRKFHAVLPLALAGIFLTVSAIPGQPFAIVMIWLSLTAACAFSFATSFWVLPHMTLSAVAAAAAIGLINSVGNLGGFAGPYANGTLIDLKFSDTFRISLLSLSYIVAAILVSAVDPGKSRDRTPS
jgi:MFS transporter, ACS family, tartrate transporter